MLLQSRFFSLVFGLGLLCFGLSLQAQKTNLLSDAGQEAICIGFYNFENLFDTINDPETRDEEFTPEGANRYNSKVYWDKLQRLSRVISEIGIEEQKGMKLPKHYGPSILGVAEIENRLVLEDFVKQEKLAYRNYDIVHYNSPDRRGVDVALLYNPKHFEVLQSKPIELDMMDSEGKRVYTRDILWVKGLLLGEEIHVFVGHWPSRRGGEERSAPLREFAARRCRQFIDSLKTIDPKVKTIVMGDLNDDPTNRSILEILRAQGDHAKLQEGDMFNPFYQHYKRGIGTHAFNDAWGLFDQIILSQGWLADENTWHFVPSKAKLGLYKWARVYKPAYLIETEGRYKGYPKRSFSFSTYNYGYSDHFPTYIFLFRNKKSDKGNAQ